jgi:hypothetical protein
LRYDPETAQVQKVGEVSDIYYKKAPPLHYVPQDKISAIDYNSKSCLVGDKIYIISKCSESYEVPKFGYWDLQSSKWEKLDDPTAGVDGGGLSVDTSGVSIIAKYSTLGGGAVDLYSPTSGWTSGGVTPPSGGFPSTFGRPWFTKGRVCWFSPNITYCEVNLLDPRTNILEKAKFDWVGSTQGESYKGIQLPTFDNKFVGSSQVLVSGDQLFLISGGQFYQVDLLAKKIAVKKSLGFNGSDIVYGDPPRSMLLVNGKVYVFAKNETSSGIIRGYAASLRSLRNVFIQN